MVRGSFWGLRYAIEMYVPSTLAVIVWSVILVFLIASLDILGLTSVTVFLQQIILFHLPHVVMVAIIIIIGAMRRTWCTAWWCTRPAPSTRTAPISPVRSAQSA